MRRLAMMSGIVWAIAMQASAQSVIEYTLELGGDNHAANWENNVNKQAASVLIPHVSIAALARGA